MFARTYRGRVGAAELDNNLGIIDSHTQMYKAAGHKVSAKIKSKLEIKEQYRKYWQRYQRKPASKKIRALKRLGLFRLYVQSRALQQVTYKKNVTIYSK